MGEFLFGRQEDVHDFLMAIFQGMQTSEIKHELGLEKVEIKQENTTTIAQIFGGYLQSLRLCE